MIQGSFLLKSSHFFHYRDQLRRILKIPSIIPIEYKRHQDSLVDKSSYRNPTMVWREPTRNNHDNNNSSNFGANSAGNKPYSNYNRPNNYQPAAAKGNADRDSSAPYKPVGLLEREGSFAPLRANRSVSDTTGGAWGKRKEDTNTANHSSGGTAGSGAAGTGSAAAGTGSGASSGSGREGKDTNAWRTTNSKIMSADEPPKEKEKEKDVWARVSKSKQGTE